MMFFAGHGRGQEAFQFSIVGGQANAASLPVGDVAFLQVRQRVFRQPPVLHQKIQEGFGDGQIMVGGLEAQSLGPGPIPPVIEAVGGDVRDLPPATGLGDFPHFGGRLPDMFFCVAFSGQ
ncbi:MAG: hypothetical protein LBV15_05550 [Planctomycetota bacterium]|nr:hypothetical protein [Planctomycetota bacterium]